MVIGSGQSGRAFWTRWTIVGVALGAVCIILITFGLVTLLSKKDYTTKMTITTSTTLKTPTLKPKTKEQVSLIFYAGPTKSNGRKKRSIDEFYESIGQSKFSFKSDPKTTQDVIYDSLDRWKDKMEKGETEFQLSAYTDVIVAKLKPSGSLNDLKSNVTYLYNQYSNFEGSPSQSNAVNFFKTKMNEMFAANFAAKEGSHVLMLVAPEKTAYNDTDSLNNDIKAAGQKLKSLSSDLSKTIIVGITLTKADMENYDVDQTKNAETISAEDGDIVDKIEHSIDVFASTTNTPTTIKSTTQKPSKKPTKPPTPIITTTNKPSTHSSTPHHSSSNPKQTTTLHTSTEHSSSVKTSTEHQIISTSTPEPIQPSSHKQSTLPSSTVSTTKQIISSTQESLVSTSEIPIDDYSTREQTTILPSTQTQITKLTSKEQSTTISSSSPGSTFETSSQIPTEKSSTIVVTSTFLPSSKLPSTENPSTEDSTKQSTVKSSTQYSTSKIPIEVSTTFEPTSEKTIGESTFETSTQASKVPVETSTTQKYDSTFETSSQIPTETTQSTFLPSNESPSTEESTVKSTTQSSTSKIPIEVSTTFEPTITTFKTSSTDQSTIKSTNGITSTIEPSTLIQSSSQIPTESQTTYEPSSTERPSTIVVTSQEFTFETSSKTPTESTKKSTNLGQSTSSQISTEVSQKTSTFESSIPTESTKKSTTSQTSQESTFESSIPTKSTKKLTTLGQSTSSQIPTETQTNQESTFETTTNIPMESTTQRQSTSSQLPTEVSQKSTFETSSQIPTESTKKSTILSQSTSSQIQTESTKKSTILSQSTSSQIPTKTKSLSTLIPTEHGRSTQTSSTNEYTKSSTFKSTSEEVTESNTFEPTTESQKLNERVSLAFYNGPPKFASRFRRHLRNSGDRTQTSDIEIVIRNWSDRFDAGLELYLLPYSVEPSQMSNAFNSADEAIEFVREAYKNPPSTQGQNPSQEKAMKMLVENNDWIHVGELILQRPSIQAYRTDKAHDQDRKAVQKLFKPSKTMSAKLTII